MTHTVDWRVVTGPSITVIWEKREQKHTNAWDFTREHIHFIDIVNLAHAV